jgi:hypothetical protein
MVHTFDVKPVEQLLEYSFALMAYPLFALPLSYALTFSAA